MNLYEHIAYLARVVEKYNPSIAPHILNLEDVVVGNADMNIPRFTIVTRGDFNILIQHIASAGNRLDLDNKYLRARFELSTELVGAIRDAYVQMQNIKGDAPFGQYLYFKRVYIPRSSRLYDMLRDAYIDEINAYNYYLHNSAMIMYEYPLIAQYYMTIARNEMEHATILRNMLAINKKITADELFFKDTKHALHISMSDEEGAISSYEEILDEIHALEDNTLLTYYSIIQKIKAEEELHYSIYFDLENYLHALQ